MARPPASPLAALLLAASFLARGLCLRVGRTLQLPPPNQTQWFRTLNGTMVNGTELFLYCFILGDAVVHKAPVFEVNTVDYLLNGLQTGSEVFDQEFAEASSKVAAEADYSSKHVREEERATASKSEGPVPAGKIGDVEVHVVYRESDDLRWLKPLVEKGVTVNLILQEGDDDYAQWYVQQMIKSYYSNTSMQVFLHGNAPTATSSPEGLVDYIMEIDPNKVNEKRFGGYASLNHPYHDRPNGVAHKLVEYRMDCKWYEDLWVRIVKAKWDLWDTGAFLGKSGRYCCSQFVVTKEAIRQYPMEFYQSLWQRTRASQPWTWDSWKSIGNTMNELWHVIFTGRVQERFYNYQAIAAPGCSARRRGA